MEALPGIQHIEQLLLSAIDQTGKQGEGKEIAHELSTLISDPAIYLQETSFQLPAALLEESIIISDALESVTNGMYNPEILNRLQSIEEDSAFAPWKYTVLAILSYYQADRDNMLQSLRKIPDETPPSHIKKILLHLTGITTLKTLTPTDEEFISLVREDNTYIQSSIQQLEEYLEGDFEDAFVETSVLLVRDLLSSYPRAARRLARWIMQTAAEKQFDLSAFLPHFTALFGKNEGIRLTALALQETDPDISILFWLRFAIGRLGEDLINREEIVAILSIIADNVRSCLDEGSFKQMREDDNYSRSLISLIWKIEDELHRQNDGSAVQKGGAAFPGHILPDTADPFSWLEGLAETDFQVFSSSASLPWKRERKESLEFSKRTSTAQTEGSHPKQLELFNE